jgi:hypothetical protein
MFDFPAGGPWYYEALFAKGVIGPRPLWHLQDWLKEAAGRTMEIIPIPLDIQTVWVKNELARTYCGLAGYGEWQLLQMWWWRRVSRRWRRRVPASPRQIVCSELVVRLIEPEIPIVRDLGMSPDEIDPGTLYNYLKGLRT